MYCSLLLWYYARIAAKIFWRWDSSLVEIGRSLQPCLWISIDNWLLRWFIEYHILLISLICFWNRYIDCLDDLNESLGLFVEILVDSIIIFTGPVNNRLIVCNRQQVIINQQVALANYIRVSIVCLQVKRGVATSLLVDALFGYRIWTSFQFLILILLRFVGYLTIDRLIHLKQVQNILIEVNRFVMCLVGYRGLIDIPSFRGSHWLRSRAAR